MGYNPDATQTWACSCWTPPDSMALNPTLAQLRGHSLMPPSRWAAVLWTE